MAFKGPMKELWLLYRSWRIWGSLFLRLGWFRWTLETPNLCSWQEDGSYRKEWIESFVSLVIVFHFSVLKMAIMEEGQQHMSPHKNESVIGVQTHGRVVFQKFHHHAKNQFNASWGWNFFTHEINVQSPTSKKQMHEWEVELAGLNRYFQPREERDCNVCGTQVFIHRSRLESIIFLVECWKVVRVFSGFFTKRSILHKGLRVSSSLVCCINKQNICSYKFS